MVQRRAGEKGRLENWVVKRMQFGNAKRSAIASESMVKQWRTSWLGEVPGLVLKLHPELDPELELSETVTRSADGRE